MTKTSRIVKRTLDLLLCLIFGPIILAVALLVTVAVWLTSGPPALFRQERAGKNMVPFILYKFRTMRTDVDAFGPSPKDGRDDRLTPIGRFLRATSLDELPQFLNVLRGEMSLVGPRPLYMAQAEQWNQRQRRRLEVKPGLTGLAQISGRGGLTIEEKLEFDVRYVEQQSLLLDLRITLATAFKMFRPSDIYEKRYSQTEATRGDGATDCDNPAKDSR